MGVCRNFDERDLHTLSTGHAISTISKLHHIRSTSLIGSAPALADAQPHEGLNLSSASQCRQPRLQCILYICLVLRCDSL